MGGWVSGRVDEQQLLEGSLLAEHQNHFLSTWASLERSHQAHSYTKNQPSEIAVDTLVFSLGKQNMTLLGDSNQSHS
jgi:hypothetical protein